MSEHLFNDISVKHPKSTVTLGLTTTFEIFAGLIKDNLYREACIAVIPIATFLLAILGKNALKEMQFKRGQKYYNNLIDGLKKDLTTTITPAEKTQIKRELKEHEKTLQKLRKDNIQIIFG